MSMSYALFSKVTLAPGEKIFFNLTGYDELNSSTYSVPIANSLTKLKDGKSVPNYLDLPNKYFVLDPYRKIKLIPLYYEVDSSYYKGITNRSKQYEIQFFDTYSSFIAKATLNVTPVLCRPGFVYDGKGSCVCDQRSYINRLVLLASYSYLQAPFFNHIVGISIHCLHLSSTLPLLHLMFIFLKRSWLTLLTHGPSKCFFP